MADFYFDETGDIRISPSGDIAITDTVWRNDAQQAYIRTMTEVGDYLLYPALGAGLSALYGMPQSQATGQYGEQIIMNALAREGRFVGKNIAIKSVPVGPQTIRFDISIRSGDVNTLILSVQQNLGIELDYQSTTASTYVTSITPSSGVASGGTAITIRGMGFTGTTSVTLAGIEVTSFSVLSDIQITATTSIGVSGGGNVVVSSPLGLGTLVNGWTYT